MTRKKRLLVTAAPVLIAVVAAWIVFAHRTKTRGAIEASGTVEATEARLGFQMSGLLESVGPHEGDSVKEGEDVASLVRVEAEARRSQAEAQAAAAAAALEELERGSRPEEIATARAARDAARDRNEDAKRDLERAQKLFDGGAVSRESLDKATLARQVAAKQLDEAEEQLRLVERGPRRERIDAQRAALEQSRAAVKSVEAVIANMTVRAPFTGVVTGRLREPGEIVPAGGAVLTVMNPSDRWVRIYVPENRMGSVHLGGRASIRSDSFPKKTYQGQVIYVAPEAEFTPKTVQTSEERVKLVYAVKVRITGDSSLELKPGMPADVEIGVSR
jgi:HlyD family secretion protein